MLSGKVYFAKLGMLSFRRYPPDIDASKYRNRKAEKAMIYQRIMNLEETKSDFDSRVLIRVHMFRKFEIIPVP